MNLENVNYDAFISYRHCELDKFVAENLHKQLEAFKIPKNLIETGKTNGKTKIERVFRDRDELPLASNLADPITTALRKSEFLIVICSPRLPESKWCLKEIETFIEMHGRQNILAVLIEGEPIDSFPDILRFDEQIVTNEDGTTSIVKTEVEPLAADVRGKDKKEVLKQIKSELLRLIAPMLSCNYDDLKMRHKEARQKKILRISLAISIVCLIFTAISTTMALTIRKQSATIETQYQQALKEQAISYASISQTLLEQEDRMAALAIARSALPNSLDNQAEKPYTASAEYALSSSLGIYNNGQLNFPVKTLEQNSPISFMLLSPDETTITTVDTNNLITIFDTETALTVCSYAIPKEYEHTLDKTSICYLNDTQLAYVVFHGFCIYDIPSQTETYIPVEDLLFNIKCSSDGNYIAISGGSGFYLFDPSGSMLYEYEWPESYNAENVIAFSKDQKFCSFSATSNNTDENNAMFGIVDLTKKELLYTTNIDVTYCQFSLFFNDQFIIGGTKSYYKENNLLDYRANSYIYSYALDKDTCNWTHTQENTRLNEITGSYTWENKTLVLSSSTDIVFLNGTDGAFISSYSIGSDILDIVPANTEGLIWVVTENGEKTLLDGRKAGLSIISEEYDTSNGNFADYQFAYNFSIACHTGSSSINIYQTIQSDQAQTVASFDEYVMDSIYSENQKCFIVHASDSTFYLKHEESDQPIAIPLEDSLLGYYYVGENDEKFALLGPETITYYDTQTGQQLETVSLADSFTDSSAVSIDFMGSTDYGNQLAFFDSGEECLYIYSAKDNSINSIPLNKEVSYNASLLAISETFNKYAIACVADDTLSVYDMESNKETASCTINASLVKNILLCEEAECVIVSYMDNSVILYNINDLSIMKTYTNFSSEICQFDVISIPKDEKDSDTPKYVLCGSFDCYCLNSDLELVACQNDYLDFDEEHQLFFLACKGDIISVPYYNYEMLIEEADKQLKNYKLSDYRKNQLGL